MASDVNKINYLENILYYIMRVISYKNNFKVKSNNLKLSDKTLDDSDGTKMVIHEYCRSKDNIFPENFLYKYDWLNIGYKSTYKKDFIEQRKIRYTNHSPLELSELKQNHSKKNLIALNKYYY